MSDVNEKELNEVSGGNDGMGGSTYSPYFTYTIVFGDTLSGIAKRFGTTVPTLQRLNNIPNADRIRAGATLLIPRN